MLRAVCHSAQNGWKEVSGLSTLSELRLDESNLIWAEAEVSHLTDHDVGLIAEEFGLHQLAVDDAMSPASDRSSSRTTSRSSSCSISSTK